ncbi:hypothetical protein AC578_10198 [Pseudocercospora eumusae]|uniref:Ecp2 effector protein domain-containing protein n=1 Tax=Pseudocercospora eumusae TaxID=321146 RepID=A0A139HYX0_9PEZI|nr:hypothetical protein AC578_10198 [Pseudocercospora eumusae]
MRFILAVATIIAVGLVSALPGSSAGAITGVPPIPQSALDPNQTFDTSREQGPDPDEGYCYLCMGCWAKQNGALVISYNVHIGFAYSSGHEFNNGNGLQDQCTNIFWELEHRTGAISMWKCKVDELTDRTTLHFNNIVGQGGDLSDELNKFYPDVAAQNPFNCPDN